MANMHMRGVLGISLIKLRLHETLFWTTKRTTYWQLRKVQVATSNRISLNYKSFHSIRVISPSPIIHILKKSFIWARNNKSAIFSETLKLEEEAECRSRRYHHSHSKMKASEMTMKSSNIESEEVKRSQKPPFTPALDDTKPVLRDPILRSDPIETEEAVLRLPPFPAAAASKHNSN